MKLKPWITLILSLTYARIYYLIYIHNYPMDFCSFYSTGLALSRGDDPYQNLLTSYLPVVKKIASNLNPPIVLWIFHPLSMLHFHHALIIWVLLSMVFNLVGAKLAFPMAFSKVFLKQNQSNLYLLFFMMFAMLMGTSIAQLGGLLLCLTMAGYYCYEKKQDILAGIFWGLLFAMKLFPGLLLLFALKQKRHTVLITMILVFTLLWMIPGYVYGLDCYRQYFAMLNGIHYYGASWNGSLQGYVFRLFDSRELLITAAGFITILCWYFINMKKNNPNHQAFCLTLVTMLILSPFGWMYYFNVLILPLALTWQTAMAEQKKHGLAMLLWLSGFFMLNIPLDYTNPDKMHGLLEKLSLYSFYFYGLLLLAYQTAKLNKRVAIHPGYHASNVGVFIIFGFGLLMFIANLLTRFGI